MDFQIDLYDAISLIQSIEQNEIASPKNTTKKNIMTQAILASLFSFCLISSLHLSLNSSMFCPSGTLTKNIKITWDSEIHFPEKKKLKVTLVEFTQ